LPKYTVLSLVVVKLDVNIRNHILQTNLRSNCAKFRNKIFSRFREIAVFVVIRFCRTVYIASPPMRKCMCVTSQHSAGRVRGRNANTDDVSDCHHVLLLPLLPCLSTSQTQSQSRLIIR